MNKVIIIGNLTKDIELVATSTGKSMTTLSVAVGRRFASPNGEKITDFFSVKVWGNQADNCAKCLKKGNKVAVVGELQNYNYTAQDGTTKYGTEIIASEIEFLSSKNGGEALNEQTLTPVEDDNLPF